MTGKMDFGSASKKAPLLFSTRLALFILCMFSTFTFLMQRSSVSFALVCMVKRPNVTFDTHSDDLLEHTSTLSNWSASTDSIVNRNDESIGTKAQNSTISSFFLSWMPASDQQACRLNAETLSNSTQDGENHPDLGEFEWSKETQGSILASFFYGYLFTQITGGWLVEKFGPRLGLLGSLLSLSSLTLLNPVAARLGPEFLFALRLLMGLTHGGALSSINILSLRWCCPSERGFMTGIAYGGFCIAAALTFPICAVLCNNFGWSGIFYATGAFGLFIAFIAYFIAYDWPEDHPRISDVELSFLKKSRSVPYSTAKVNKKQNTPWKSILLSVPVNVVHVTHCCFVWGFLMIGMYLPMFLKEVLYLDTSKNGLYSSLPYFGMLAVHFTVGSIFDFFKKKNFTSLTNLRKIFNTFGTICPTIALISLGFLPCDSPGLYVVLISIAQAFADFAFMGGYMFSIFEMAPKYAGVLTGITNTYGVLPGFLCPALVSYITRNGTREEWILAFVIAGAINFLGCVVYLFFGSSKLQPWALGKTSNNMNGIKAQEMLELQADLLEQKRLQEASEHQNGQA